MLEFSDTVEINTLRPFVEEHIDQSVTDFDLEEVLTTLGMPREAKYFAEANHDKIDLRNLK
jgi:hypothetical protein